MPALLRQAPGGVGQYFDGCFDDPGRVLVREVYSSTCGHCAKITEFPSRRKMFEHVDICRACMKLICLGCYGKPCRTQEALAEHEERKLKHKLIRQGWGCY